MDFSDSSDGEPTVAYDDFVYSPYIDPSTITPLWKEHFQRPVKDRNPEVNKAFETECSIYNFMYPELRRTNVISEVTKQLKAKTKPSKKPFKLIFKNLIENDYSRDIDPEVYHDEYELKSEFDEAQDKYPDVTVKGKNITDVNNISKSDQKNLMATSFVDEKFSDFKETSKILCDDTKELKPGKEDSDNKLTKKLKLRGSKRGKITKFDDKILNTENNLVTVSNSQSHKVLKIANVTKVSEDNNIQEENEDKELKQTNKNIVKKTTLVSLVQETNNESPSAEIKTEPAAEVKQQKIATENKTKLNPLKTKIIRVSTPVKLVTLKIIKTKPNSNEENMNEKSGAREPAKKKVMAFKRN